MTYDVSKGFTIAYNRLNLPQQVSIAYDNAKYTYDASGVKLAKTVNNYMASSTRYYYSGNFLYENSVLKCIFTPEGRVVALADQPGVLNRFEYNLKDHLGNTRVTFTAHADGKPEVNQLTSYDPYGFVTSQTSYYATGASRNKLLYNGKELQDDNLAGAKLDWYDYGARFYDPVIGRWHSVDPLAEDYVDLSPYSYCAGNPIACRDENGEWINFVVGAVVGGGVEYISQVAANVYDKGWAKSSFTDVDVSDIGLAMIEGAATSGASAIRNTAIKTAVKVGTEIATEIGQNTVDVIYSKQEGSFEKDINSATEVTVNTAIGLTAGKLTDKVMPKGLTNGKGPLNVPNKKTGISEARNSGQRLTTEGRVKMENKNISKKEMNKSANNQLKQSIVKTPSEIVQNKLKIDEKK